MGRTRCCKTSCPPSRAGRVDPVRQRSHTTLVVVECHTGGLGEGNRAGGLRACVAVRWPRPDRINKFVARWYNVLDG